MLRRRLILSADFERCAFPYFFAGLSIFFSHLLRCVRGIRAAFDYFFPASLRVEFLLKTDGEYPRDAGVFFVYKFLFMVSQFFIFLVCPILSL